MSTVSCGNGLVRRRVYGIALLTGALALGLGGGAAPAHAGNPNPE